MPFLENVLRGKNVPRERMLEVAEHYYQFGGRSPINDHCRALVAALRAELETHGPKLPVYWGNRNWNPLLPDTLKQMAADGVRRAVALPTSAYASYSGCRQYLENIEGARAAAGPCAPLVHKLRPFSQRPLFLEATADRVRAALERVPEENRNRARLVYTAHSIPLSMATTCQYEAQLRETGRKVAEALGHKEWDLVWQSRSGPPSQPWLEPDVCDHLRAIAAEGVRHVVLAPIGFLSDHMEVLFDLDTEAATLCDELGLTMVRAETVGTHRAMIRLFRELIVERATANEPELCPPDCCPAPRRG